MYFQNFKGMMPPQPLGDGRTGWTIAMSKDFKGLHVGDPTELGRLVARALEQPETFGQGQHLAQASETTSWQGLVDTLNAQGHNFAVNQVPNDVYDSLPFPGALEFREMMNYFEEYTYFGPNAENKIALARKLCPEGFTTFEKWASQNMKP